MTTPKVMRDLDEALARAVRFEVDARSWRIKSGQWRLKYERACEEIVDLKAQLSATQDVAAELVRMVDVVRAERDTARAVQQ